MAGDTVRLYTRQNDKTLLMLEHGGRILNQRVYVQLHFRRHGKALSRLL